MLTISIQNDGIVGPGTTAWSSDDTYEKTDYRAGYGAFAAYGIRALRCPVRREPLGPGLRLHGPTLVHDFRTAYFSREPAGHRCMSTLADREALPHGDSRSSVAQHHDHCERDAQLANLRRFRATRDRNRPKAVYISTNPLARTWPIPRTFSTRPQSICRSRSFHERRFAPPRRW